MRHSLSKDKDSIPLASTMSYENSGKEGGRSDYFTTGEKKTENTGGEILCSPLCYWGGVINRLLGRELAGRVILSIFSRHEGYPFAPGPNMYQSERSNEDGLGWTENSHCLAIVSPGRSPFPCHILIFFCMTYNISVMNSYLNIYCVYYFILFAYYCTFWRWRWQV